MPSPDLTPAGPGSVSGVPHLPAGPTDTFTSRYFKAGDMLRSGRCAKEVS
jgi:hypothetical protein